MCQACEHDECQACEHDECNCESIHEEYEKLLKKRDGCSILTSNIAISKGEKGENI